MQITETSKEEAQEKSWAELGPELLVEMAKKGEINPWDVDLVFVIDKFLSQLSSQNEKQELKQAAHIIFLVSVLLRIKSQDIYTKPTKEESSEFDDLMDFEAVDFEEINENSKYEEMLTPKALDTVLSRNPKGLKQQRTRKITLDDLIGLFREVELKTSKRKRKKKTSLQDFEDEEGIILREDEDTDILDLAVDENLEQKIEVLSQIILDKLQLDKQISLSDLKNSIGDKIDTFLSALFLTHSGKTEIAQETFYEEIWLRRVV
ncbi:MAG: segregation/condensation protein A [Candidatus Caenarcaniphilales bacterium]|nr:segregation/condensation protein A [Candidatus Caenarcaniphilales bacterium]